MLKITFEKKHGKASLRDPPDFLTSMMMSMIHQNGIWTRISEANMTITSVVM